jgi:hypothetical protein
MNSNHEPPFFSANRRASIPAQGNALGKKDKKNHKALKGRPKPCISGAKKSELSFRSPVQKPLLAELEMAAAYKEYCAERAMEKDKSRLDPGAKKAVKRKPSVRSSRAAVQSSSIQAAKGSRPNQCSPPESTQPAIVENIESGQDSQHPPHSSPTFFSSLDQQDRTLISPR